MRKLSLLLAFLAFIGMQMQAQRQITGTVTNSEDGSTIPGVSVYVKGDQKTGTVTDINGKYSLKVTENAKALVFSFVGMNTVEATLGASNVVDAKMTPASTSLVRSCSNCSGYYPREKITWLCDTTNQW